MRTLISLCCAVLLAAMGGCGGPNDPLTAALTNADGPLAMSSITPGSGVVDGETVVLIHGTGFTPGMQVKFGDVASPSVRVVDDTMLTATVPSQQESTVDVSVQATIDGVPRVAGIDSAFQYVTAPRTTTDTDGDGLSDAQEVAGWKIRVDYYGFGTSGNEAQNLVAYTVVSNPANADTDGDGLSDSKEFINKCDASLRDTDGDGLSDFEEVARWHTSPQSVDSDGDARGPDGDKAPVPALFDGNELFDHAELIKTNYWDRSGLKVGATSPSLADTDGDGATDYDELDANTNAAVLADVPRVRVEAVDQVDIRLDVEYAEEQGQTTAYETSYATGTETSQDHTVGSEVSASVTVSASMTVGVSGGFPSGVDTSVEASVGFEASASYGQTQENSFGKSVSAEEAYSNYSEDSKNKSEAAATGSMTMGIRIHNEGDLAFKMTQLSYTVRQWVPAGGAAAPGSYKTMGTLRADLGGGVVLAPGASSDVIELSAQEMNADRVKAFLAAPETLYLEPAAYEIENAEGQNFKFQQAAVLEQTAEVLIDYGPGLGADEFRVATNVDRSTDGSVTGIKMKDLMNICVGPGDWQTSSSTSSTALTVSNAGFESGSCGGQLTGWVQSSSPVTVCGGSNGIPTAPEGSKWAQLNTGNIYQKIGTFNGAPTYGYSFWHGNSSANTSSSIYLRLWAGNPTGGGQVIGTQNYTINGGAAPVQRTGTISAGPAWNGREIWVEIGFGSGGASSLIDAVSVSANTVSQSNLISVKNIVSTTGPRSTWAVLIGGQSFTPPLPNFEDIMVHAGERVILGYFKDVDADGLWDAQERHLGTSDQAINSDNDGLSDPEEVVVGWNVSVAGQPTYTVFSDPAQADADGDGLNDFTERSWGTDPYLVDTDADGLPDNVDPAPLAKAGILYVNAASSSNAGPGTSWATAYQKLESALTEAINRNSNPSFNDDVAAIWVAAGSYSPPASQTWNMANRVAVYGGFAGNETKLFQRNRDPLTNRTLLTANGLGIFRAINSQTNGTALDGFSLIGATSQSALWVAGSNVAVRNCLFANNRRTNSDGGGVFLEGSANVSFEDCIFTNNSTAYRGGAVYSNANTTLTFNRCRFDSNTATGSNGPDGGAIASTVGTLVLTECVFNQNTANDSGSGLGARGGAIWLNTASLRMEACEFEGNATIATYHPLSTQYENRWAGGAISVAGNGGASLRAVNCVFWANTAPRFGGAVYLNWGNTAQFVNCTLYGNKAFETNSTAYFCGTNDRFRVWENNAPVDRAPAFGGAIATLGTVRLQNCILWNNVGTQEIVRTSGSTNYDFQLGVETQVATYPAGALALSWDCVPTSGGGLYWESGSVVLEHSVVMHLGTGWFFGVQADPDCIGSDPLLRGGSTGDFHLASGSPCIDAGERLTDSDAFTQGTQFISGFDLDGKPRVADGDRDGYPQVDIGAFEY